MKRKFYFIFLTFVGFIFNVNAQGWQETAKVVTSDRSAFDLFGYSVDMLGNYAIVGAPNHYLGANGNDTMYAAGAAYIFEKQSGVWVEVQKLVASDRGSSDDFGWDVAISDQYAFVGSKDYKDTVGTDTVWNAGAVYVFENQGGNWIEIQKLTASDRDSLDEFGWSVAVHDDFLFVGSWQDEHDANVANPILAAGSVYVFQNQAGVWTQTQKLVASDRGTSLPQAVGERFGNAVSLDNKYAVIGAYIENEDATGAVPKEGAGAAYVFENQAGTWVEVQKIVASDRDYSDAFGRDVDIDGNTIVIGAFAEDHDVNGANFVWNAGSAYIFENQAGTWTQTQKIVAFDRGFFDEFATTVSISGDYVIIGANQEDEDETGGNTVTSAGSAYLFRKQGANWTFVQKMLASDRGNPDHFGYDVVIDGYTLISGSINQSYDASGGNYKYSSGAAYFYECLPIFSTISASACSEYLSPSGNHIWTASGIYTDTLNTSGCDSIVTVNLTISTVGLSVTVSSPTLTAVTGATAYQWIDCNNGNAAITGATGQSFTPVSNGSYAVIVTQNGCSDTSACYALTDLSAAEYNLNEDVLVYPSPTDGLVFVNINAPYKTVKVTVRNVIGQTVFTKTYSTSEAIEFSLAEKPSGTYLVELITDTNASAVQKLIVE